MSPCEISVVIAFLAGTVRAVDVWRAASRVDVINVVVLSTLAEGRSRDLPTLLRGARAGAYRAVAEAVAESAVRLLAGASLDDPQAQLTVRDARVKLERDATRAVVVAARRGARDTWLDAVTLVALMFAGVTAAVTGEASAPLVLGLVAATLLWVSNVWGSRSNATRMYAGAMALAGSLAESLDELRSRGAPEAQPEATRDGE